MKDLEKLIEIVKLLSTENTSTKGDCRYVGTDVIIRTYSAGVWFGTLDQKDGNEVILVNARRMWRWHCKKSISLSGVALFGLNEEKSRIAPPVDSVWLEAIEIIECKRAARQSIEGAKHAEAE